jgi:type VI protein secretion system component Hcp
VIFVKKLRTKLLVAIAFLMMVSSAASAATVSTSETPLPPSHSVYLKLDGIAGESTVRNYERWIVLSGVQFGVSNNSTNAPMTGGGAVSAGKASLDQFTVTKALDASSVPLLQAALTGTHIKNGQLVFLVGGEKALPVLTIDLGSIMVAAYEFNNEQETIQLNFESIKLNYFPTNPNGSKTPSISGGWSFKQNAKQ